jgi:hypothetical protein
MKIMYGTRQAEPQWFTWTEDHGYAAVYSQKNIFMKRVNNDWIMHGLFVDDMIYASTNNVLKQRFVNDYTAQHIGEFEITCEDLIASFLGMEVEKDRGSIRLHLDNYNQEILAE